MTSKTIHKSIGRRLFLKAALASTLLPMAVPAHGLENVSPFSFAFVSDIHLSHGIADSYMLTNESQLFFQDLVRKLNQQKLDFVVFGGDQIQGLGKDDEHWQLFLDIVQGLNCPWTFVLGETDISSPVHVDKMQTFGRDWRSQGIDTTTPYWSFSPMPKVHLVGLDTASANTYSGFIDQEQLNWLKNDLAKNSDKLIIVFSHHPLLAPPPYQQNPSLSQYLLTTDVDVRQILKESGRVKLAVSGHTHVNQIAQEGNIWYVAAPSLVVYPCAYKVFHVSNEGIAMDTQQIGFEALVKKAEESLYLAPQMKGSFAKRKGFISYTKGNDIAWQSQLPFDSAEPQAYRKKRERKANG